MKDLEDLETWNFHIDRIMSKCEKVINILRSLAGSDWGAERVYDLSSYDKI